MFGGGRRYGGQPQDPFEDMMNHVFGGAFFGPPPSQSFGNGGPLLGDLFGRNDDPFGGNLFFSDPFFRSPFNPPPQHSSSPGGQQGATVEEVPHEEPDWPSSNHQPLVEEPEDAGGRSPRSRSGHSGHGPHGDEVSPRRHSGSDSLSDGWLGGGGGASYSSSTQYGSFGGRGGGFSTSTTTRCGPDGTVEIEEMTQDGETHSVKTTRRIGDKGRTTVRTRDAAGVEETRETLHGLTQSQAEAFDAEWLARSRPSGSGSAEQQRRRPGWLRLPGFGGGGGGGSAGATDGPRNITIT